MKVEKGVSEDLYEAKRGLSMENIGKITAEARVKGSDNSVFMLSL